MGILVVDQLAYWRSLSARTLKERGFEVRELSSYDYSPETAYFNRRAPDLVVLGCASIKVEERELIKRVIADAQHLLVLCTLLPWGDARWVFLAGDDDVTDKTYDPDRLVSIVELVLKKRVLQNPKL